MRDEHRVRVTAIRLEAGRHRALAALLGAGEALAAFAASPGAVDDHRLADHQSAIDGRTQRIDPTRDLVSERDRQLHTSLRAVNDVQVGMAYAAAGHLDSDFAAGRLGQGELLEA